MAPKLELNRALSDILGIDQIDLSVLMKCFEAEREAPIEV